MTDFVKQLKEHINISEIVGEYVRLKKTGSNHMGLCPFHGERSPSFSVSEKKGIYYCFGCHKSGDAISFLQEIQSISFHEAVRTLAGKANVKLPPEFAGRTGAGGQPGVEDKNEVYYKLNRFVAQFYHEKLLSPQGAAAREYLTRRGITEATIKTAYLGYASSEWAELYDFLAAKQAPLDKAEELGLIRRKSTGADASGRAHYDLFRDRVMFPVVDTRGRVIAFGGRMLGNEEGPKYLNSSESPVFKKGNNLFGLFYAQKEMRAEDLCVVVEGFMDCIALQQAGIGHTVATLGTALTERHVSILKRFTRNIIVLFDGDAAGQEAQARAMETFLNEDIVVRAVSLPDQYDPDEFVKEKGAEALTQLLKNAPYLLDQQILDLVTKCGAHAESRARAVEQILPWMAKISAETSRVFRLQELAGLFDVKAEVLERRVNELRSKATVPAQGVGAAKVAMARPTPRPISFTRPPAPVKLDALDEKMIESVLRYPALFVETATSADRILDGLETEAARALVATAFSQLKAGNTNFGSDAVAWTEIDALKTLITRSLVVAEQDQSAKISEDGRQELNQAMRDLERKLVRRGLERKKDVLRATILKSDGSGQSTEFSKLMNEYNELVKLLDETKATGSLGANGEF